MQNMWTSAVKIVGCNTRSSTPIIFRFLNLNSQGSNLATFFKKNFFLVLGLNVICVLSLRKIGAQKLLNGAGHKNTGRTDKQVKKYKQWFFK